MVPGTVGTLHIPFAYAPHHGPYSLYVPRYWWAYNLVLVHFPEDWPKAHHYYLWARLHGDQVDWDAFKDGLPAGTAWLKPMEACA